MTDIDGIQHKLKSIRMRCRVFWITLCGGLLLAVVLIPISQGAGQRVGLIWVILSIATWMSSMMSICLGCQKDFRARAADSALTSAAATFIETPGIQTIHCGFVPEWQPLSLRIDS